MTHRAPSRPLDELLCSDCRTGIPLARVDGTTDRLCFGCISAATVRAESQAAIAEAESILMCADDTIRRRLEAIGRPRIAHLLGGAE
jgi:hypothetical protein